jgi:beta-lactamase superfamily II metal-dependent hydrolase
VEKLLLAARAPLEADILKVGHHGSKYSSGNPFLSAVRPLLAVVEVGERNTYRHPTVETLARLASSTARAVLRTDIQGTVSIVPENGKLRIFTEK